MKGQEFDVCDLPFDGYYAPQVEIKRRHYGCPFNRHNNYDGKQGFGSFGRPGFDNGPGNQGPPEDGNQRFGWGRWGPPRRNGDGPSEHLNGPPGFGPGPDGRPQDFYAHRPHQYFGARPWWFGRRGPSESAERPEAGPWQGPDHHRP